MPRFTPYFGIVAAIAIYIFIIAFSVGVTILDTRIVPSASSTISVVSNITLPTTLFPNPESEIVQPPASVTPQTETVTQKKTKQPSTATVAPPTAPPVPVSAPTPPYTPESELLDASASALRAALINIICYVPSGSNLHSMSGSGVIVDSKGIILTNAHIAQYFLLADRGVSCSIRSGGPAISRYEATLIYIPKAWLRENASVLTQINPTGTGEYDFAFLAITKSKTSEPLPSLFPFVPLAITPPTTGTPVVIASYGAQFLESSQIQSSLFPTIVFGSVKEVFTFAVDTSDVIALGGSAAAQEGSSGGGVIDASGKLVGTITTSTTSGTTDTRALDAITSSYIRSAYASETGQALDVFLLKPISDSINDFAPKVEELESILTANL